MKELQEKQRDKDRLERSRKRPKDRQTERDRENEEEIKDQEGKQGTYRVFENVHDEFRLEVIISNSIFS